MKHFDWIGLFIVYSVLAALALVGCGRYNVKPPAPILPTPAGEKIIVAAFGAEWCPYCKQDIPALDAKLANLPKEIRDRIDFRLYVVTEANAKVAPTDETARRYKQALGVSAAPYPDPWKWQTYKKWVGGDGIPAAAVVSADGKVLKRFPGGQFDATGIAYTAEQALK